MVLWNTGRDRRGQGREGKEETFLICLLFTIAIRAQPPGGHHRRPCGPQPFHSRSPSVTGRKQMACETTDASIQISFLADCDINRLLCLRPV